MKRENRQICPVSAFRTSGRVEGAVPVLQAVQVPFCAVANILCPTAAVKLAVYGFLLRFKRSKMPTRFKFPVSSFRFPTPPNKPNRSGWPEEKCERMLA